MANFEDQLIEHRVYLMRFARLQLRNDAWAEDAVSETLLAALEKGVDPAAVRILRAPCVGRCAEAPVAVVGQNAIGQDSQGLSPEVQDDNGYDEADDGGYDDGGSDSYDA